MNVFTISKFVKRASTEASLKAMQAVVERKKTYFSPHGRYGAGWKPLRKKTIEIKKAGGAPKPTAKNYRTGGLMRSLRAELVSKAFTSVDDVTEANWYTSFDPTDMTGFEEPINPNLKPSIDNLVNYEPMPTVISYKHAHGDDVVRDLIYNLGRNFLVYGPIEIDLAFNVFDKDFKKKWKNFVSRYGEERIAYVIANNIKTDAKDDYHLISNFKYRAR